MEAPVVLWRARAMDSLPDGVRAASMVPAVGASSALLPLATLAVAMLAHAAQNDCVPLAPFPDG